MAVPGARGASGFARLVALALLLVVLVLWSGRHLGLSPEGEAGFGALAVAVGSVLKLLERPIQRERRTVAVIVGRVQDLALDTRTLVAGYLLLAVLVCLVSSVTVIGASTAEEGEVTLRPLDHLRRVRSAELGPNLQPAHFRGVLTNPFGRTVRIDAPGYVPATFELFPITGLTVRLGRDVAAAPTVLFRPPPLALGSLADPLARFRLELPGPRGRTVLDTTGQASFLVGEDQPAPADARATWSLELRQSRDPDPDATLLRWLRPVVVAPPAPLVPGAVLRALVVNRAGDTVATGSVRLRAVRFMDVPMIEVRR